MDRTSIYRAVWRWHFYAGLIILPVLCWMAITGGLYLYKPEIERALHPSWHKVRLAEPILPIAAMVAAVEHQVGGKVQQVARPAAPDASWRMTFTGADGEKRLAFVKPDMGQVLGTAPAGGEMEWVKQLHSLTVAGPIGNVLVEIVAGWAIVLVLTGFYLWWPRGGEKALSLAGRVSGRRFWRNFHASVGVIVGAVILFLAVTGMPWSIFWGSRFHAFVAEQGIGRPKSPDGGGAHHGGGDDAHLSWAMRGMAMPHGSAHGAVTPEQAVAAAEARGLAAPWILDLPKTVGKPYRISAEATRSGDVRLIYVDAGTGAVLQDVSGRDFGIGAKAFEWGIYTHQGQQYGEANRLVMLAGCIGVLLLAASAPAMWWKRRKGGRLAPPPRAEDPRKGRGLAAIMLVIGAIFPLTAATMLAALIGEWGWRRLTR
jgi:uncharacterized iron-regulated membrane protein